MDMRKLNSTREILCRYRGGEYDKPCPPTARAQVHKDVLDRLRSNVCYFDRTRFISASLSDSLDALEESGEYPTGFSPTDR